MMSFGVVSSRVVWCRVMSCCVVSLCRCVVSLCRCSGRHLCIEAVVDISVSSCFPAACDLLTLRDRNK